MALGQEFKKHGITTNTPKNILLGAGTIYKGLKWNSTAWDVTGLLGATSGGTKVTITPEYKDVEVDGAIVKTKGLTFKVGEIAKMETNLAEITPDLMALAINANQGLAENGATDYNEITAKSQIEEGDYIENLGYVGKTVDGTPIIIIFDYALCTSGLEIEGKNKDNSVIKLTFECFGSLEGDLDKLPYHIYYPQVKDTTGKDKGINKTKKGE